MFGDYVYEKSGAEYIEKILLIDKDNILSCYNYCNCFSAHGFYVIHYIDDLDFRTRHDSVLSNNEKYLILASENVYIPYDIRKTFREISVSYNFLFPNLNSSVLKDIPDLNLDLLTLAYKKNFSDLSFDLLTEQFIKSKVYGKANVKTYIEDQVNRINDSASKASTYKDWIDIIEHKSEVDVLSAKFDINSDFKLTENLFADWMLLYYGKLSAIIDRNSPVLVSRAMEYMFEQSEKFILIVMDGMSQFDWKILSSSFSNLKYNKSSVFAMVPTVTSVSRQCLLSNKYPIQLDNPWSQSKEKSEFIKCAENMGFLSKQIDYQRGYDADFGTYIKCGAVIINEIDDIVHGQGQGRTGMFNDVNIISKRGKLLALVERLLNKGFDVYISADHGNTPCVGDGKLIGTGVETETKSHRMLVLKDFADKDTLIDRFNMIEFPKYFLPKEFDYLVCSNGHSLDSKNKEVMSHGGITLDEVIVPFITIKAGENNV